MNKVYAVGCLDVDLSDKPEKVIKERRLWYMYPDLASAEKAVLSNELDMFECNFNFALIEEITLVGKGFHPYLEIPKQWWYGITRHGEDWDNLPPTIEAVDTPECMKNIVYFWVG